MAATLDAITKRRATSWILLDDKDPDGERITFVYRPRVTDKAFMKKMRALSVAAKEDAFDLNYDLVFEAFAHTVLEWDVQLSANEAATVPITLESFEEHGVPVEVMAAIIQKIDEEQSLDPLTRNS